MHPVTHSLLSIRSLFYALLLLGGTALLQPDATAQPLPEPCVGGTQYFIAFPDTVRNMPYARSSDSTGATFGVMVYSPVAQVVEISRGSRSRSMRMAADEMIEFSDSLLFDSIIVDRSNVAVSDRVLSLSADYPIVVYAWYSTAFGTAAFTPLPVETWGTDYVVATWPADIARDIVPDGDSLFRSKIPQRLEAEEPPVKAPAQILLIAAEDDTEITLDPTGDFDCVGCPGPLRLTLDRGETFLLNSTVDTGDVENNTDIAGSTITASNPIGVVVGNTRTQFEILPFPMLSSNSVKDLTAEWLAPTTRHGRSFTMTPTLDLGWEVRKHEVIRVFATVKNETVVAFNSNRREQDTIDRREFRQIGMDGTSLNIGHTVTTSSSAQVFHGINATSRFDGLVGSGDSIGARFTAWGSAMVEMIPQRRWTSFAPIRVPTIDSNATHFLTVVASVDDAEDIWIRRDDDPRYRLPIEKITGDSTIAWAHVEVEEGRTYRLYGENGARFSGRLQGGFTGFEVYNPSGIGENREDEGSACDSCKYQEKIAGMYAMPLSGSTCPVRRASPYLIETLESRCDRSTYKITRPDGEPLDIARLELDEIGTVNGELVIIEPAAGLDALDTAERAVLRLRSLDPDKPGSGRLLLQSGEAGSEEVEVIASFKNPTFDYSPESILLDEAPGTIDTTIMLHNRLQEPVELTDLEIAFGTRGFSIVGTDPQSAWKNPNDTRLVMPGDSIGVIIRFEPGLVEEAYDTLVINLPCSRLIIPLQGSAAPKRPCTSVDDLDFGVLDLNASRTEFFKICNRGEAPMTFEPSGPGGSLVSWDGDEFSISPADMQTLANANLAPNQCVTIRVTFASQEATGAFRTVARFYTNETTGECRDSSVWTAQVGTVSVGEESGSAGGLTITSIAPNPGNGTIRLNYRSLDRMPATVTLIDASGRERQVTVEHLGIQGDEQQAMIDASHLPSGVYFVHLRGNREEVVGRVTIVR